MQKWKQYVIFKVVVTFGKNVVQSKEYIWRNKYGLLGKQVKKKEKENQNKTEN